MINMFKNLISGPKNIHILNSETALRANIIGTKDTVVSFEDGTVYPIPDGMRVSGYSADDTDIHIILIELPDGVVFKCGSKALASTTQEEFDKQYRAAINRMFYESTLLWNSKVHAYGYFRDYPGLDHLLRIASQC